jgi:hypothetical protein
VQPGPQGPERIDMSPNTPADRDPGAHQLVLVKRNQRWVFRYAPGEESAVLRQLAATASDPHSGFDWFDAAVLSHQMGNKIHHQLDQLMTDK